MGASAVALFYAMAAMAQWALGLVLLSRRRTDDGRVALGLLFGMNGTLALLSFLNEMDLGLVIEEAAARTLFLFDQFTNLLIAYFALTYPRKIAFMERHPWIVRGAFSLLALLFAAATFAEPALNPGTRSHTMPEVGAWWGPLWIFALYVVLGNAFSVLLVRWAFLAARMRDVLVLRQFQLLFAAFALRGLHIAFRADYKLRPHGVRKDSILVNDVPAYIAWDVAHMVMGASVVVAVVVLFLSLKWATSEQRKAIRFVLIFMAAGAIEGIVLRQSYNDFNVGRAVAPLLLLASHVDYMLVRPVMAWVAMARHQFASIRVRGLPGAQALLVLFAIPTVYGGILPSLGNMENQTVLALTAAAAVSVGLAFALKTPLRRMLNIVSSGPPTPEGAAADTYVAALHDFHRRGSTGSGERSGLNALARRLKLSRSRQGELETVVETLWASIHTAQEWHTDDMVLGRYEIEKHIGSGGMGHTFLARDLFSDDLVVLKRGDAFDGRSLQAIVHESRVLDKLRHPNIVSVLRTEQSSSEAILVLPYLIGGSLSDIMAERTLKPSEAKQVAAGLLDALAASHRKGILHRDIKPSNILFDGAGNPILSDFGIAQSGHTWDELVSQNMAKKAYAGSWKYLPPERWHHKPASRSTDLYGLGLCILEATTGSIPDLPRSAASRAAAQQIMDGAIRRAPATMRRFLGAVLQQEPENRPADADAAKELLMGLSKSRTARKARAESSSTA